VRRTVPLLAVLLLAAPGCSLLNGGKRYSIPSGAMEPTLMRGDKIGCSTDVPDTLKRGMVVVFRGLEKWSPRSDTTFVKRVIGLPGERVESKDGRVVLVDGSPIAEPYLGADEEAPPFDETVPEGQYFVMGDNRDGSSDSRFNGPVPHGNVQAVCTRIVSPKDRKARIPGT